MFNLSFIKKGDAPSKRMCFEGELTVRFIKVSSESSLKKTQPGGSNMLTGAFNRF